MVSIDLTDEEIRTLIALMDNATVSINKAQEALDLYKKFKDAKD